MLTGLDDGRLEVCDLLDEPEATHHVLDAIDLERPRSDIEVAVAHGTGDLRKADAMGPHRLGIHVDLVLLNEPAYRGDLGHPGHGL